ncbi:uncharacterized protein B0H18DRAFT_875295, partial [Fomitopsis serialis]|uniref:uncharacterized protein n=1 Tax=Fomitopsis serialis TaxID=139415 RepID=UPI00200852C2
LTFSLLVLPLLAYAVSLPDTFTLLVPPSQVQVDRVLRVGAAPNAVLWYVVCSPASQRLMTPKFLGLVEAVNTSLIAPNGTKIGHFQSNTDNITGLGSCVPAQSTGASGCDVAADEGTYTIIWNVAYTMSSDPSQANASYCGPSPFSTQTCLLNETFEATKGQGEATSFTNMA